ncbi:MAG TPA: hypothetical protein VK152_12355 [Paludibacter sp.]|nr:hypothetical protein [Paludibacter sp.]
MKTSRLLLASIAMSAGTLLLAENPQKETRESISQNMVGYLHSEVNLADSQKVILAKKAGIYADKLLQARAMEDREASYDFMRAATEDYQAAMDSVLTTGQKELKEKKHRERIDKIIKDANSKK